MTLLEEIRAYSAHLKTWQLDQEDIGAVWPLTDLLNEAARRIREAELVIPHLISMLGDQSAAIVNGLESEKPRAVMSKTIYMVGVIANANYQPHHDFWFGDLAERNDFLARLPTDATVTDIHECITHTATEALEGVAELIAEAEEE